MASGTGIDLSRVAVGVTADWSQSDGSDLAAHWRSIAPAGCPANSIAVVTYLGTSGDMALSNAVAFSVVVP